MFVRNPHAIYINCDGAMDYDKHNTGGIGFIISFPDNIDLQEISISKGIYIGGNIERLEYEALIQAMKYTLELFDTHKDKLKNINQIILVTDRFALNDQERTNPYKIQAWRQNKWKNHEGKPIKNEDLLDQLDKTRKKLSQQTHSRVNIQFRPRKKNKQADKLAKKGKLEGLKNDSLAKKGEKIGKRLFDGAEIKYIKLKTKDNIDIHVFRKDPAQDLWEIWVEICDGVNRGYKLKIYADNKLSSKLQRRNYYTVRLKEVFRFHVTIYKVIKKSTAAYNYGQLCFTITYKKMLTPKTITIGDFKLEPPHPDLDSNDEKLVKELLEIFSLKEVTKFNNNYKLSTPFDAQERIYNISSALQQQLFYTYRLYDMKVDRLVGTIELLAPISVHKSHRSISKFCFQTGDAVRNNIWLIEYYLHPDYWRQGIMTKVVSAIIEELFNQNARYVGAVCHNKNIAGNKFLSSLKFIHKIQYKNMKDHFLWIKKTPKLGIS